MTLQDYVEKTLQPKLQGDGGWVEYKDFSDGVLTLVFRGECSKCMILPRCCDWISEQIKHDLKKDVKVSAIRKRPYFQDV